MVQQGPTGQHKMKYPIGIYLSYIPIRYILYLIISYKEKEYEREYMCVCV